MDNTQDYRTVNIATQSAFDALVNEAVKRGIALDMVPSVVYIPSQEAAAVFKAGCKAVIDCMRTVKP